MFRTSSPEVTTDEKRHALAEALQSATLARSARLKNLLRFICEAEIDGRSADLNEYEIGVQALGQPASYSPTQNSTVRSRIHELRQRLEQLYSDEIPDAPFRIQLPKGSHTPRFVRNDPVDSAVLIDVPPPATAPVPAAAAAPQVRSLSWRFAAAFLAGCVLTYALTLFLRRPASPQWTPELAAIWSPFEHPAPVLVSFEPRLFVRIGSVAVRDWTVDEMTKVESSARLMSIKDLFHQQQIYENRNYADFGAVQAAFRIAALLGSRNPELKIERSSEITPDDARNFNLIVLSKPSTDPALREALTKLPFVDERVRVHNLSPKPGEPGEYVNKPDWKDPDHSGERYLLITLMPGEKGRRLLSLASFNSEDPWALSEYLTEPEHVREMYIHMRLPNGRMPDFYQLVVKVLFRAQAPVHIEYVTHRVLSRSGTAL
ncbi:MAG TPA: hypothetical protein VMI93_05650 [Candidatus Solibacter sp.]|nr:hypothetical protein [Candidatus Solibacter sp.]